LFIARSLKLISLKQSSARMILKKLGIPNVPAQRVHGLMAGNVHHFEYRSTLGRRRGQEARAQ
jgi:hypothetical protein